MAFLQLSIINELEAKIRTAEGKWFDASNNTWSLDSPGIISGDN